MDWSEVDRILLCLRNRPPFPLMPHGVEDAELAAAIEEVGTMELRALETEDFRALVAGLHLWNDDLERSHAVSQEVLSHTGSYWHGIMHRREGDYANAKYWLRRVGEHPAQQFMQLRVRALAPQHPDHAFLASVRTHRTWDAFAFVDACMGGDDEVLRILQLMEIELLVRHGLESLGHE